MGAIFCPSCGVEQPPTNHNRRDFYRCVQEDCQVPFIEDPWTEVLDDSILRAASTLARRGLSAVVGVVRRTG